MSHFRKFFHKNQAKVLPEHYATLIETSMKDHNYFGWKLYFKNDLSSDTVTLLLKHIQLMKDYINANLDKFNLDNIRENLYFSISFNSLVDDVQVKEKWPTFSDDLTNNCKQCLACIGLAMHQTIIEDLQKLSETYVYEDDLPVINVRLLNHYPVTNLQDLHIEDYNKLITVCGTVIKAGYKALKCTMMAFKCSMCDGVQAVAQNHYKFTPPRKCLNTGCKQTTNFIKLLSSMHTKTIEQQNIKIQDLFRHSIGSAAANNMDCHLTNDLVNSCAPGDDIVITGILKVKDSQDDIMSGTFSMYIEAISLHNNKKKGESFMTFTEQDYHAIREIHDQEDLFRMLVHSLCPYIYGHEIVKAGLLLTMFGGNGNSSLRSNSHILVVGDPGLGKSQMLKACADVAPRGMYVCGTTSTNAGLTASVTKENGEYSLDAGALLLSDTGTCCIDEFDKMPLTHQDSLLEVMEQQCVSLAKAGIVCSLSTRTKVIAAANPIKGHYDRSKTILENLHISQSMLSRFDLIFLLLDQPNEQHDSFLSDHIIELRTGRKSSGRSSLSSFTNATASSNDNSLKERLKLKPEESLNSLSPILLKKYIVYAQTYVHPTLTDEAKNVLKTFYLRLHAEYRKGDSIPITIRILESMKRLTEARAKLELREQATKDDALEVIEILKCSNTINTNNLQVFETKTTGGSLKKKIDQMLDILNRKSKLVGCSIFSLKELEGICDDFHADSSKVIELLNRQGSLLMKGNDKYQFIP